VWPADEVGASRAREPTARTAASVENVRVTDSDHERPLDYRMIFAAERTYLAYLRTSLALLAAGIAVVGALPHAGHEDVRRVMGAALVFAGLVTVVGARNRWKRVEAVMRTGGTLPRSAVDLVAVVAVIGAGLLGLVYIALS
jgi:putative membrane protein